MCDQRRFRSACAFAHFGSSRKHAYIILTSLKPHFYIIKLGFTGVYIIFISLLSTWRHINHLINLGFVPFTGESIFERFQILGRLVPIYKSCPPCIRALWSESSLIAITKTCLYNFDPLKPQFYIVKLGIHYFFLFLLKNIDCGYSLEPPRRGGSNEYHNLCFDQKYVKYRIFLSENFHYLVV